MSTFGRRLGIVCAALLAASCGAPVEFGRGKRIALDAYTVTVSHSDTVDIGNGQKNVVVHFRVEGLEGTDGFGKFLLTLGVNMSVVDGEGNEYVAKARTSGRNGWVAEAKVPLKSRDFRFVIRNPDARAGQPGRAAVPLGL